MAVGVTDNSSAALRKLRRRAAASKAFVVSATGATGRAVPAAGGYRVTGHWPFGSGAHHGTYFAAICEVDEGRPTGQGRRILVYVPRSAVSILDTWYVSGLCATGSCDFAMADVDVASDFTHDFQAVPTAEGAIYRLPPISAFSYTVATVPLGIATAARNAFVALAVRHKRSGGAVAARPAGIDPVRSRTYRGADGRGAGVPPPDHGGPLRRSGERRGGERGCPPAFSHDLHPCGRGCGCSSCTYCEMAGAAAIFESSPLERCERDVRAAIKHVAMSPAAYVTSGMAKLGLDVGAMRF